VDSRYGWAVSHLHMLWYARCLIYYYMRKMADMLVKDGSLDLINNNPSILASMIIDAQNVRIVRSSTAVWSCSEYCSKIWYSRTGYLQRRWDGLSNGCDPYSKVHYCISPSNKPRTSCTARVSRMGCCCWMHECFWVVSATNDHLLWQGPSILMVPRHRL
jgi:hypothetical protein